MSTFLSYLTEASVCLIVLYFPFLLYKNNTFFGVNRIYLLSVLVLSVIIPLFQVDFTTSENMAVFQVLLEPVRVVSDNYAKQVLSKISLSHVIFYIYISGTFICLVLFFIRIFQIMRLVRRNPVQHNVGYKLVTIDGNLAPSTFFQFIFIPKGENAHEILAHEKMHICLGHSYDVIFLEFISVFFWFHPVMERYKNSLKNIHEYQADREILMKGIDVTGYQKLLVEKTFGFSLNELVLRFNYSPLKKRLKPNLIDLSIKK